METIVDFVGKISDRVRSSFEETARCIGKEVVDSTAGKKGICIDRITDLFGTKTSFLGIRYTENELDMIRKMGEDVLVCHGAQGKFFVDMDDVSAVGKALILLKPQLKLPEIEGMTRNREDVFKRLYLVREALKDVLPNSIPPSKEEGKKWLKKLMGE